MWVGMHAVNICVRNYMRVCTYVLRVCVGVVLP